MPLYLMGYPSSVRSDGLTSSRVFSYVENSSVVYIVHFLLSRGHCNKHPPDAQLWCSVVWLQCNYNYMYIYKPINIYTRLVGSETFA